MITDMKGKHSFCDQNLNDFDFMLLFKDCYSCDMAVFDWIYFIYMLYISYVLTHINKKNDKIIYFPYGYLFS
jgi:hypothetical protein